MNLLVLTQFINPFSTNGFDIFKEYRSRKNIGSKWVEILLARITGFNSY